MLVIGFGLGALSVVLRRRQGARLHGHGARHGGHPARRIDRGGGHLGGTTAVGLDWFLLNLFVLALLFVPLERVIPRLPAQPIFRPGWTTDLMHFAMSHLMVQVTVVLTMLPAALLFRWATQPYLQDRGGGAAAGAPVSRDRPRRRLHPVLGASGLSPGALALAPARDPPLVGDHGLAGRIAAAPDRHRRDARPLVRAALRARLRAAGRLRIPRASCRSSRSSSTPTWVDLERSDWFVATPRFHHWHHAATPVDKNFAVHSAVDRPALRHRVFARRDAGPRLYGITGRPVPEGYWHQLAWPLLPDQARTRSDFGS